MFTVDGYINGVAYTTAIGGEGGQDDDRHAGCVTGDPAVIGWLREHDGEPYQVTPTGPSGTLDLADPGSVYGTLLHGTRVTSTSGDVPDLVGPARDGVAY